MSTRFKADQAELQSESKERELEHAAVTSLLMHNRVHVLLQGEGGAVRVTRPQLTKTVGRGLN